MSLGSLLLQSHGGGGCGVSYEIFEHLDAEDVGPTASVSQSVHRAMFGDNEPRVRNQWRSLAEMSCSPGLVGFGARLEHSMVRKAEAERAKNSATAAWRQTLFLGRSAAARIASTDSSAGETTMELEDANVRDPTCLAGAGSPLLGEECLVRVDFHSERYDYSTIASRRRRGTGNDTGNGTGTGTGRGAAGANVPPISSSPSPISLFFEPSDLAVDNQGILTIPAIRPPAAKPAIGTCTPHSSDASAARMDRIAANEAAHPDLIDLLEMSSTTDEAGEGSDLRLLVYIIHLPSMRQHVLYDGGARDGADGCTDEAWVGASFEGLAINKFMEELMDVGLAFGHNGIRAGGGSGGTLQSLVRFQVDAMIGRASTLCYDLKIYFSMNAVNHRDGYDDDRFDHITRTTTIRWLLRRGLGIV
jgi:hypothetical protein